MSGDLMMVVRLGQHSADGTLVRDAQWLGDGTVSLFTPFRTPRQHIVALDRICEIVTIDGAPVDVAMWLRWLESKRPSQEETLRAA